MAFISDILNDVLPDALELLETPGTLTLSSGTYDPIAQTRSPTTADTPVDCSPLDEATVRDIDGTEVKIGDFKTMVAAAQLGNTLPRPGTTRVTIGGRTYQVVKVSPISGGPSPSLYILFLRGL